MTQLIINGTILPLVNHDKYKCYPQDLAEQIEMISGRVVQEVRGTVQIIEWSYDKMPDETYRSLLGGLRGGEMTVTYLPDDSDTMQTSKFICTEYPAPTFAFARNGKALWHNVSFKLREARPHD
jgi:hypothetical protein